MAKIATLQAREILSSGSFPTIEVCCILKDGSEGRASVPFGVSAGVHEVFTLFDEDKKRYDGKGMQKAVSNVNSIISKSLTGIEANDQRKIDETLIRIDGTASKKKLGGNAILGVSLAVARAASVSNNLPLYKYIRKSFSIPLKAFILPHPMMVVIEGGVHADNSTDLQEYMVSPFGRGSVKENVRCGIEIYSSLKKILRSKGYSVNVGNEGAFAPSGMPDNEMPLKLIEEAIRSAGYQPGKDAGISLDPAVSEIFSNGKYDLSKEGKKFSSKELIDYFSGWVNKYPVITLEDPLHEDDWENWPSITSRLGKKILIVGDDLTVTNPKRLRKAIELKAINAILIKLNQIGTLTETVDCCMLANKNGIKTIVSHRGGGETNDTFMIDLAVAVNSAFVKVGPSRGERVEKYNRLMEIEDKLLSSLQKIGRAKIIANHFNNRNFVPNE